MKSLAQLLADTTTEEELKKAFAKFFNVKLGEKNYIDLYTPQILFEFNLDAPLTNLKMRATCIARTLYYIRRLKYGNEAHTPSNNICIVTKKFAVFFATELFKNFYTKSAEYDWDLAPSSPCKKLIADLAAYRIVRVARVYYFDSEEQSFTELIRSNLAEQSELVERKEINENNFQPVFQLWQKMFVAAFEDERKASEYFITDIEEGKSTLMERSILLRMNNGERVEKFIKPDEYKRFWSIYEKISEPNSIIAIRQKMDRMTEISTRRFTGEFFTPIAFAKKAVEYLARTVGENWYRSGKFRLWDMAAGTGNLELALPAAALKYCYISTLHDDDVNYCKRIFPDATVFQYDYLNDDVNFFGRECIMEILEIKRKMPAQLVDDLANPEIRWIIFINPPYVMSGNSEGGKAGVTNTAIRKLMRKDDLGEVSRELASQFIYRISREFKGRLAWLSMFSKTKYLNANNDQKLRDKVFSYRFLRGFLFSSQNFDGCKGEFPVGFLIWHLNQRIPLSDQKITLDVYNTQVEKIAEKTIPTINRENLLSKWIERPPGIKKFPPMSGALNIAVKNKIRRDRIAENFLAAFLYLSNDFTFQRYTSFLSAPYVSAGSISVTPENFEQSMIMHMVHQLPKKTWLNDSDQFLQPAKELTPEFISDAVIWSLFATSNHTVSLRNIEYEGETYRIPNNFFPFELAEVRTWACSSPDIRLQLESATEDRFAATWIKNHEISAQAQAVFDAGRELYKKFYAELATLDVQRWKIADWDAGWYQIRMASGASLSLAELSAKLLPQIYEIGFLNDNVKYL